MADRQEPERGHGYSYAANSNLVLQAKRTGRRDKESDGTAESLWGKLDMKQMGDKAAARDKPQSKKGKKPTSAAKPDVSITQGYGFNNILQATEDLEGLSYAPKTTETKQSYELILSFVQAVLGDTPQDLLRTAVDEILIILKTDNMKDLDKKVKIENEILSSKLESDQFAQLVNLSKRLTDYSIGDPDQMDVDDGSNRPNAADAIDVAVVFDEDEDEESEDDYVKDKDSEDEQDGIDDQEEQEEVMDIDEESTTVITSGPVLSKSRENAEQLLNPHDVDAFWLQRNVTQHYPDAQLSQEKTEAAMAILSSAVNMRDCENELMELFDYDKFDLVKMFTRNRLVIVWCTKLAKAASLEETSAIHKAMIANGAEDIMRQLQSAPARKTDARRGVVENAMEVDQVTIEGVTEASQASTSALLPRQVIDLDSLAFQQGGHLMSNKKCRLPEGSFKKTLKGYEEVHVPVPKSPPHSEKLINITSLPEWAQKAFAGAKSLNRIQSKVYPVALKTDDNMLLCAPTGAGKTNCAMLTILRVLKNHTVDGSINLSAFKIVYIAPMKALVAEMVGNFGKRLSGYGVTVAELTGDRQLTKQQISDTQIIITTPEKWDIITRKATDQSYTNLVRLIIIDEIHLLHDDRGPVLESIVARTLRGCEETQRPVRLVGLSATLPNYTDVAKFLRVDAKCVFYFDNTFRPCPLQQQFIGITEKKAIKRFQLMNEIVYYKVMEDMDASNQVMIFVHSRKETAKAGKTLRDMAVDKETVGSFVRQDGASREILATEAQNVLNPDLQDLLPYGIGIHHAGMNRADRTLVEDLFKDGHIQVLCSTATLAWGVNLPAHTVIIRGTQVYSPEKGRWVELSPQDVLQMLGRAGRPQFDTHGEGIIITQHAELQYYLSLLNIQLPIESQYIRKLSDNLNAEIVLGTVQNRDEAVEWLGYTYLYVRMRQNPALYGVSALEIADDPYLRQKRVDLIHAAANVLDKCNLVKYDRKTGKFQGTELGRIASHYYISHQSISTYNLHLKPTMSQIDLFRVFALSEEFKYIPVRDEEKLELVKMLERVPIPVKESMEEPTAKINVLLQSYISQLKLEGFALMADMVFVTQSAGRILRAIFEICLRRGWAQLSIKALNLCKMVDKRMWLSMSPLRQFKGVPAEIIKRLERKEFPWERYFDLNSQELGELAGMPKTGKTIHKFVHQFPKLDLQVHVQPVTRSLLRVDLTITPDFEYDEKVCGSTEAFWVFVEDADSETTLHHEYFVLKHKYAKDPHHLSFTVELFEPLPPNYFISVVSDRWLRSETRLPVSFKHLILPDKYPPHTELLDLQPKLLSALGDEHYQAVYKEITTLNPIQTQVFNALYATDDNIFIGAPAGSGKVRFFSNNTYQTFCAEFALLRLWKNDARARCVYIAPFDEVITQKLADWNLRFGSLLGGKSIVALTGESSTDLKLLETGDIIFATPNKWDMISRRWKQRKNVKNVGLFIADEVHLIGGDIGPTYEIILSRMRYISAQTEIKIRIVALGTSLANARDVGEWIGISAQNTFNFHPSVRPLPLEIHIQGFNIPHFPSMMIAMAKPTFHALTQLASDKPAIVFVPSRKQCRLTSVNLLTLCAAEGITDRFLQCTPQEIQPHVALAQDTALAQMLEHGIAFYHEALSKSDRNLVEKLFKIGAIRLVIASKDTCWALPLKASLVVIMGAQYYEGKEHRYADYQLTDILQMMGLACKPTGDAGGKCVLMCQSVRKDFYKKFLYEALPVESHLDHYLHDHFNAEIVTKTIENKQDAVDYLTWTFYYRRLVLNPNYYNLQLDNSSAREQQLSDHLSELIENTLEDLSTSKCISIEDDEVSFLNLGMIASYYYINYMTMEMFSMSLSARTKIKGLLEIISASLEFENVPIRHHEDGVLEKLLERLPSKISGKLNDPHTKTQILLAAHFSRLQLPSDLEADQKFILEKVIQLVQASVDVISSNGWLAPAFAAMELSQMIVQAVCDRDSPLRQLPHINAEMIKTLNNAKVETIFDLMDLEDDARIKLLNLDAPKMLDVASFANRYPNIEVIFELDEETVEQGGSGILKILLEREMDESEESIGPVITPFYPKIKDEGWWVVIGDPKEKTLLAIKRTTLQKRASIKLDFSPPDNAPLGKLQLKLYLMCDCYAGVDQEFDFTVDVIEGCADEEEIEDANE